jgi:predicted enzyme related to lactoylglutathione lyase
MSKNNPVGWFEIYVEDINRAKTFYQNVFKTSDFIQLSEGETKMYAFPRDDSKPYISGSLVQSPYLKPSVGGTIVYFNCIDCAVEENRVEKNGGTIIKTKFSIGEFGFITIVKDTEGNLIGLHSRK